MRFLIVNTTPISIIVNPEGKNILFGFVIVMILRINIMNLNPSRNGRNLLSVPAGLELTETGINVTLYPAVINDKVLVEGNE